MFGTRISKLIVSSSPYLLVCHFSLTFQLVKMSFRFRTNTKLFRRVDSNLLQILRVLHQGALLVRLHRSRHLALADIFVSQVHHLRHIKSDLEYSIHRAMEEKKQRIVLPLGHV